MTADITPAELAARLEGPWTCFHCGEVFHDEREARLHFGPNEEYVAACVIKSRDRTLLRSLREAEAAAAEAWGLLHSESSDFAKAYHSMVARHSQALIRAEEAGYERGLHDSGREKASEASDHLTNVLFADPGPKLQASIRAATEWWHAQDRAALSTPAKDGCSRSPISEPINPGDRP